MRAVAASHQSERRQGEVWSSKPTGHQPRYMTRRSLSGNSFTLAYIPSSRQRRIVGMPELDATQTSSRTRIGNPRKCLLDVTKGLGHLVSMAVQTETRGRWMRHPTSKRPGEDSVDVARSHHTGRLTNPLSICSFWVIPQKEARGGLGLFQQLAKSPEVHASATRSLDKIHIPDNSHEAIASLSLLLHQVWSPHPWELCGVADDRRVIMRAIIF